MANFTESRGWKLFMGKLYGLGAAVVIVGALFKLEHFPGASIMLIVGMSVEAFIFVCSAFEPLPHPEPHWELVYPELAAGAEMEHISASKEKRKKKPAIEGIEVATVTTGSNNAEAAAAVKAEKTGVAALAAIGHMDLSKINVEKLSSGLNKLGETTEKLTTLSNTVVAANTLSEKMHHASLTVANFSQSYENSAISLSESIHALSDSYHGSAEIMSASVKQVSDVMGVTVENFAKTIDDSSRQIIGEASKTSKQMATSILGATEETVKYISTSGKAMNDEVAKASKQMADMIGGAADNFASTFSLIDQHLKSNLTGISEGNHTYNKQVEALNKNMNTLNAVYELQAQETGKYHKNSATMGQHLEKLVTEFSHSVEENRKFSKEIAQLNKSIGELNGIYGSMLSAVQLATGKK
ncbi:MAG: gliding motility protein GldL [Prevotellaceae bacterium]|jgi:gliding motility-associated protein GldL|nr:gliding motility protein GldL [Prevotellaceae bacterium]